MDKYLTHWEAGEYLGLSPTFQELMSQWGDGASSPWPKGCPGAGGGLGKPWICQKEWDSRVKQHFFQSAHRTFSSLDCILGQKSSLSKFKKTETVSSIFSDHNALRCPYFKGLHRLGLTPFTDHACLFPLLLFDLLCLLLPLHYHALSGHLLCARHCNRHRIHTTPITHTQTLLPPYTTTTQGGNQ